MKRLIALLLALALVLSLGYPTLASDPFVGEVTAFAGSTPPAGWVLADGSNMSATDYPELCNILDDEYGTIGVPEGYCKLPDLRGVNIIGFHPSASPFDGMGNTGGGTSHTLTVNEMPSHRHSNDRGSTYGSSWVAGADYYALSNLANDVAALNTTYTGGGQPHNIMDPYIVLRYIIYVGGGRRAHAHAHGNGNSHTHPDSHPDRNRDHHSHPQQCLFAPGYHHYSAIRNHTQHT